MSTLKIERTSDAAKALREGWYTVEPLDREALDSIRRVAEYGLALHAQLGIDPPDALPIHLHPRDILSMIAEINHHRSKTDEQRQRKD